MTGDVICPEMRGGRWGLVERQQGLRHTRRKTDERREDDSLTSAQC